MKKLTSEDLAVAQDGSYYTIIGTGEPLDEWVTNYEAFLADAEIGKPKEWFTTTGAEVNEYARRTRAAGGYEIHPSDKFKSDLTFMLFPLTDLHVGRLAVFKMKMQDRWFDDIIQNMRVTRA